VKPRRASSKRASSWALAALAMGLGPTFACAATERAQSRDPMKCERNPNCAAQKGVYVDCSEQCSYDPECTDRCTSATMDQPKH
jgi:hypothetical protein